MKRNIIIESNEKLFKNFEKLNSFIITESTSYLINNGMVKRALTAANLMVYKDEISDFDIAEAIAVYVHDYNDNNNVINQFKGLLKLSKFNPSQMFKYNYEELGELSKMIYDAIVDFYETNNEMNELNTSTYSDLMNKTSEYPWEYFFSKNPDKETNRKELGKQNGRINTLARDRFVSEFYKEFPINTITINTIKGQYIFIGIKFEANYTRYDVFFEEASNFGKISSHKLWISPSGGRFYINNNRDNIEISDPESIKTVLNLLKYNKEQQKANMSEEITYNIDSYFDDVINNLYKLDSGDKVINMVKSKQKYFDLINRNFNGGFDANKTANAIRDHWYGV